MTDGSQYEEQESLWDRFRRRKVVQWGLLYIAGAWGFLQGLEYLSETFDWPQQLRQFSVLVVLVGLPIVLVVAWYHGDRGEQRVRGTELLIVALLFLAGGAIFWLHHRARESAAPEGAVAIQGSSGVSEPVAPPAAPYAKSIAVLPFADMSAAKDQEYMSDGIAEELLNLLVKIPDLKVIARTSSFAFKGKDLGIPEIGKRLNVANVLEGSVRTSGGKVRITAQLIRAADSVHVWSETYDRPLDDVFEVQDEIAAAVVSELKVRLLGEAPKSRETNPKAYALYLQARARLRQFTKAGFAEAIELFYKALEFDPSYAAAWTGLATTYSTEVGYGQRLPEEGYAIARDATSKALALDAQNAEANTMLGWIAIYHDKDFGAAARYLERALALEPTNPDIINVAAVLCRRLGRLDEAIALGRFQTTLDPGNPDAHDALGYAYRYAGRLDEALVEFRTALTLSPGYIGGHEAIGEIMLQKGDARAALEEIQLETDEVFRLGGLAMAQYALGRKEESDTTLAELIRKYAGITPYSIAIALAYRNEPDRAFEWLDKAFENHDPLLGSVAVYQMFAGLHSDPRWLPFLQKLGMAPEQLASIRFDVTVPD